MAKYKITYACGHEEKIQICGPTKDREWKAENEAKKLCGDCYAEKREAEKAEWAAKVATEAAAISAGAAANGLPALIGSAKQIAWAETLRAKAMAEHARVQANAPAKAKSNPNFEQGHSMIHDYLASHTAAKWWIDHRSYLGDSPNLQGLLMLSEDLMASLRATLGLPNP